MMIHILIERSAMTAVLAGLILATPILAKGQSVATPPTPEVPSTPRNTPPAPPTPMATPTEPQGLPAPDAGQSTLSSSPVSGPSLAMPVNSLRLSTESESDIHEELMEMKEDSAGSSHAVLRPRLMAQAEKLAAGSLNLEQSKLIQYPAIRRQIRAIVRSVLETPASATHTVPVRDLTTSAARARTATSDHSDETHRCECEFCHSLHAVGTCTNLCTPLAFPLLPTVASQAPATFYVYPYYPRSHHFHGLLCPCLWCRGRYR